MPEIDRAGWTEDELRAERDLNAHDEHIDGQVYQGREHAPSHYVLDDDHNTVPVGLGTWAIWSEHQRRKLQRGEPNLQVVKQDDVGEFWVSTVFLGLDHGLGLAPSPRLFETMVFAKRGDERLYRDLWMERYTAWEQAAQGHEECVAALRAGTLFGA